MCAQKLAQLKGFHTQYKVDENTYPLLFKSLGRVRSTTHVNELILYIQFNNILFYMCMGCSSTEGMLSKLHTRSAVVLLYYTKNMKNTIHK